MKYPMQSTKVIADFCVCISPFKLDFQELHDSAFPNPTPQTWRTILKDFGEHWDYPTAIGALDGKHVSCVVGNLSNI